MGQQAGFQPLLPSHSLHQILLDAVVGETAHKEPDVLVLRPSTPAICQGATKRMGNEGNYRSTTSARGSLQLPPPPLLRIQPSLSRPIYPSSRCPFPPFSIMPCVLRSTVILDPSSSVSCSSSIAWRAPQGGGEGEREGGRPGERDIGTGAPRMTP